MLLSKWLYSACNSALNSACSSLVVQYQTKHEKSRVKESYRKRIYFILDRQNKVYAKLEWKLHCLDHLTVVCFGCNKTFPIPTPCDHPTLCSAEKLSQNVDRQSFTLCQSCNWLQLQRDLSSDQSKLNPFVWRLLGLWCSSFS